MAQEADILINHTDSPDPGPAGGEFVYTMRITNNGPNPAENVEFVNTMPPGSTFVSFTQTGGQATSCNENDGGQNTCSIGTLPVGDGNAVIYALRVVLPTAGVYTNRVNVSSTTHDPNPANNTDNDNTKQDTTATAAADLVMNAEAQVGGSPVTSVIAGQEFNYVLSVTNQGPNAVQANGRVRVEFTVPTGVAVRSAPSGAGWSCTPGSPFPRPQGTVFTCERTGANSALAFGDTTPVLTVPAVTNIAVGTGSEIQASFDVSAFQPNTQSMPDGNLANNNAVVPLESTDGSDLAITKARSPATVAVGENITFTLTPRFNGGLAPGGTITVTDTLHGSLDFVSASGSGWTCGAVGQTVTCTRSDGASFTNFTNLPVISLIAAANAAGTSIPNTAEIEAVGPGAHPDPVGSNNTSSVTFNADDRADLSLTKSASLNPVLVGQAFNYSLTVRNNGPLAVPSGQTITVTDVVPENVRITSAPTGTDWSCVSSSGSFPVVGTATLTCTRTTGLGLGNNATTTITVPAELTAVGMHTNDACVELAPGTRNDSNGDNDCDDVGVTASGLDGTGADLRIVSKTASPNPVNTGENLTYVITVRNDGPDAATNVRVTDSLSNLMANGGVQSISPSQGSCTPAAPANGPSVNVQCELDTLASGAEATVTIVVRPRIATTGPRTNTATVWSADVGDPDPTNNSGSVTSEVVAVADLEITKSNTPDPVRAGAPLTYVVTVRNPTGLSTASNVVMTDTLPANAAFLELVDVGSADCTTVPVPGAVGGELVCEWSSIPTNSQRSVSYRVRPLAGEGDTVTNTAEATTSTRNSAGVENPTVSATTTTDVIEPELDVLINKSDDVDPVPLGGTVRYTISITNNGPSYGTNAVMTDVFPTPGETPTALFSYQGNLSVSGGGVCDEPDIGATAGELRCTWPGLADGETQTVAYDMIAEAITTPGAVTGTGYNRAIVAVDEVETTYANNERNETTDTFRAAIATDLSITKTADPAGVVARGSDVEYTVTVLNNGPLPSTGAQVIDTLPAGLQFVSAAGCVEAGGTVTCSVGSLAVGAERSFLIVAHVPADYDGPSSVVNRAVLDALGDTDLSNNEDEAEITVPSNVTAIPVNNPLGLLLLVTVLMGIGLYQNRRNPRD
ncbi:MAG TPA: hypothetical protein PLN31_17565 [Azoarcus taiwanensis]|nr:hypothetical protein [Azoarcus taiwanensis]